jgi:Na+/melibiose symporter-like transporter
VKNGSAESATTIREALAMPPYRIALVLAFIGTWVFFGMRASILPVFVTEELNSTTAVVGYGFAISAIVQGAILAQGWTILRCEGAPCSFHHRCKHRLSRRSLF